MQKILLAVGFRQLEEYLEKQLRKEFIFVGSTVYREGVIRAIGQKNPDIVILRETLDGNENIMSIVYEIRTKYPKIRIVFVAGKREPGDALLSTLVSYGIYDILHGEKVKAQDVIRLIRKPNEYKDVQHLQPKPVLDEKKNQVLFETPDILLKEKEIIKEVVKEVYIDNGDDEEPNYEVDEIPLEKEPKEYKVFKTVKTAKTDAESSPPPSSPKTPKEKKSFFSIMKGKYEEPSHEGYRDERVIKPEVILSGGKQKIITFMGAKHGVGNTSIALNTAVMLAQKKQRVIFIEMNDRNPSVGYWYELGYVEDGIDKALSGLEENKFEWIEEAIIPTSELRKKESLLQKNYKKFPEGLDFMFYSNRFLTREPEDLLFTNESLTKDLYLYLLFQLEYDYIVIDVSSDIWSDTTKNALMYSNKIFMTVTQDVSTIGHAVYLLNELNKKGIHIQKKIHYIVNKFEKAELGLKEIEEWIQASEVLTVPCMNKEFINSNFIGMPIVLASKSPYIKSAFQRIEKTIR